MVKCDICKMEHKEYDDIYEWYCHFRDFNHKCYNKEIWDIENCKWIKVTCCENNKYTLQRINRCFKGSNSSNTKR